jgi:Mycothiol maleylpyruvate isomerase N-terminal domain
MDASEWTQEERLWTRLRSVVDAFDDEQALEPGYFEEGWTVKDALAHVGTWLAEAGVALEQIRGGTYVELREDEIDAMNARFLDAMRDVSLVDVKAQASAARWRMLNAWTQLDDPPEAAERWVRKAGADHYGEHLPRLEEWFAALRRS